MFCEHCGSQIPDGSKFCTECGTPVTSKPAPPAQESPSAQTEAPFWQQPSAEPAVTSWQQPAAESRPTDSGLGYSTPGSGQSSYSAPSGGGRASYDPVRPNPGEQKTGSRWWLWLIIGLVIVALIVAAAYLLLRARVPATPEPAPVAAGVGSIRENASGLVGSAQAKETETPAPETEAPKAEIPEELPEPPKESEAPASETGELMDASVMALVDEVDTYLDEEDYQHEVETDEDAIYVYLWYDGIDALTDKAALDGDADALAKWNEDVEYMRQLSEDILTALYSIDKGDYVYSIVGIQDDLDPDSVLAYAVDGEVIYDWVNGVDTLGLMED